MADWPTVEELAQVLDVENIEDWEGTLERVLAAAINQTKGLVGSPEDDVTPDEALVQLSLYIAQVLSERPSVTVTQLLGDPRVMALLPGHRRRFAVS